MRSMGRTIRFDHSHFEGKQNAGAMFVVVRLPGWPLDNRVRIDHNYFGPRPVLGSNTGETMRIGTSEESLSASHSVIENNLFERTDGEVEIISIKSGGNAIRGNLFLQAQGAVVLRHGNGNTVEANIFKGMGAANAGGIRVINRDQIVRNNYLEGLAGRNFRGGALADERRPQFGDQPLSSGCRRRNCEQYADQSGCVPVWRGGKHRALGCTGWRGIFPQPYCIRRRSFALPRRRPD